MRRHLPAWVALVALSGAPALADDYEHVYDENDPKLEDKIAVEKIFGMYLVKPPRRHAAEQVELYRNRVTIRYWYSLGAEQEQIACDGLSWILFGRHQWAGGIQQMLDETEFQEVNVEFIHVPRAKAAAKKRKRKRKGKVSSREFRRFVEFRLSKRRLARLSFPDASEAIAAGEGCSAFMKKNFDRFRFDASYYARELRRMAKGSR